MKQEKDFIEAQLGAKDSELGGFEYTIPQGYEAEIKDGKVIVRKAESEDEKIRKWIIDELKDSLNTIRSMYSGDYDNRDKDDILRESCLTKGIAWLEKQGEQKTVDPIVSFKASDWYVNKVDGKIYNAKFMEEPPINQKRRLDIEKAAFSATGIIEQEEWFIKGAEWSDKNPLLISSEKQGKQKPVEEEKTWTVYDAK